MALDDGGVNWRIVGDPTCIYVEWTFNFFM